MFSEIERKIINGERLNRQEALFLFKSEDLHRIGELAEEVSKKINQNRVYFIVNRHINPTNICVNRCRFCAFSRSKGEPDAYEMSIDEIIKNLREAKQSLDYLSEVHIVSGLHPDWQFEHYLDIIQQIKKEFPSIGVKAFTAVEVDYFSRISGLSIEETLIRLKEAGVDIMPGGGAEIFNSDVRAKICPEKISGERWLEIIKTAHSLGIKTNATMLYGHLESYEDRVDHLLKLRDLQDQRGGFLAFIPLSYQPENTQIKVSYPSGIDDLKTIAVSRLVLDNIPHIKAYWIMLGEKLAQLALLFGADCLEGTVIEERIAHAAGARSKKGNTIEELVYLIKEVGKIPVERDSFYNIKRTF
ncbi:aminofutalosine synthase MqnE [Thermodesulfovibrio yellowstonii]|uniref:aminofutalosine synthase MqnE n=1 Tax=Thermodesulfovibrio yellowstonii TaxID=28262 RepID=UPI0024B3219D|nr:aminofutalosine synthase MqnE [Thermodesulfovibrio yellowstonii]MDI6865029.1 aminofutalosine synthase MqnE [Thermodesulfovibrio yellowstonii]